jgi:hypothetical protein
MTPTRSCSFIAALFKSRGEAHSPPPLLPSGFLSLSPLCWVALVVLGGVLAIGGAYWLYQSEAGGKPTAEKIISKANAAVSTWPADKPRPVALDKYVPLWTLIGMILFKGESGDADRRCCLLLLRSP